MSEERGARAFHQASLVLVCAGFLFGATTPLLAQKKGAAPACVFDTAAHSVQRTWRIGLLAFKDQDTSSDPVLTRAFDAIIRPGFVAPPSINQLTFPGTTAPPGTPIRLGRSTPLSGLRARFSADGSLSEMTWEFLSFDFPTDAELLRQLTAAAGTPALKSIAATLAGNEFRLHLEGTNDSLVAPLLTLHTTAIIIDKPATYLSGPSLQYPERMLKLGISGEVLLRYVVDGSGRVASNSVRVVSSTAPDFIGPATEAVLNSHFQPARTAGCTVPILVEQRVHFRNGP
jgi:TonB family protein